MATVDPPRPPHVALLAFPFGTHAAPLFALARALAAAAPDSALSFISSARCNAALRQAAGQNPGIRFYDVADGSAPGGGPPPPPPEAVRVFLDLTPGNFRAAVAAAEAEVGFPVSCFTSDAFLWFAADMAAEGGAAWVPLFAAGGVALSAHLHTDVIRGKLGCSHGHEDEKLSFIPGFSSLQVRDLPEGIISGDLQSSFASMLHRMAVELPRANAVALNIFEGLAPEVESDFKAKFKQLLPIGPLHLLSPSLPSGQDDHRCLPWLDRHDPGTVVYISFGSMMLLPPAGLLELAVGLEASRVPFLWSLKESQMVHLPKGFLSQGLLVSWAPQVRVLAHPALGAFVTHCGWNSVMESIVGGVPMICRPFLGDQMLNSRMVSHVWRTGVRLEGDTVTKDSVCDALNTVLKMPEGKEMRERAGKLKVQALDALSTNGSSTDNFNALVKMVTGF